MVDIRRDVCGIIVAGSPAPGINAVINAITIQCEKSEIVAVGFLRGFKHLKEGVSTEIVQLELKSVTRNHNRGGSLLFSSKTQLENQVDVDNALRALEFLRVRYVITIGGTATAYSAHKLARAAVKSKTGIRVIHVPKTIFNDLPLPENCHTFGYNTARELGAQLVDNLSMDAKAMNRWYVISAIGSRSGHLSLGIGAASASTLTLIPEEFKEGLSLSEVCDHIDASMLKRYAIGKQYGVAIVTEGLVEMMCQEDLDRFFGGSIREGHATLAHAITHELERRWEERQAEITVHPRAMGFELRGADPNAHDIILARELGFAAIDTVHSGKFNAVIVTMKGGNVECVPLSQMINPATQEVTVKTVDVRSLSYEVAKRHMILFSVDDLRNPKLIRVMSKICRMSEEEVRLKFKPIATPLTSTGFSSYF